MMGAVCASCKPASTARLGSVKLRVARCCCSGSAPPPAARFAAPAAAPAVSQVSNADLTPCTLLLPLELPGAAAQCCPAHMPVMTTRFLGSVSRWAAARTATALGRAACNASGIRGPLELCNETGGLGGAIAPPVGGVGLWPGRSAAGSGPAAFRDPFRSPVAAWRTLPPGWRPSKRTSEEPRPT